MRKEMKDYSMRKTLGQFDPHESWHPSFTDRFEYLPKLAKALIDLNSKVDGESTTYSTPPF
jgi:hypothetical protein